MNEQEADALQQQQLQQQSYNATIERQQRQQREYLNGGHAMSQSLIMQQQQQRAPSAYSMRDQMTPSRQAYTSSATNVSIQQPQQQLQQQSYGLNGYLSTSQQITKRV